MTLVGPLALAPSPPPLLLSQPSLPPPSHTGLLVGSYLFAPLVGESAPAVWTAFALLTALHVYANWQGVGCLALLWLNRHRAVLASRDWAASAAPPSDAPPEALSPAALSRLERPWGPFLSSLQGPRLGARLPHLCASAEDVCALRDAFAGERRPGEGHVQDMSRTRPLRVCRRRAVLAEARPGRPRPRDALRRSRRRGRPACAPPLRPLRRSVGRRGRVGRRRPAPRRREACDRAVEGAGGGSVAEVFERALGGRVGGGGAAQPAAWLAIHV